MRKTFELNHPKIKRPRLIEAAKSEFRKSMKRTRRRALPDKTDYWAFDCKFGSTESDAMPVHEKEVCACIDDADARGVGSFYVEAIPRAACRSKKPVPPDDETGEDE